MWLERQYFFTLVISCETKGNIIVCQSEHFISETTPLIRSSGGFVTWSFRIYEKTNHIPSSTIYKYIDKTQLHVSAR